MCEDSYMPTHRVGLGLSVSRFLSPISQAKHIERRPIRGMPNHGGRSVADLPLVVSDTALQSPLIFPVLHFIPSQHLASHLSPCRLPIAQSQSRAIP